MRKKLSVTLAAGALVLMTLCGVLTLSGRARAAEQETVALPILMYHHISKSPERWGKHVISPETFEGDLQYLADNGYTLSLIHI